MQWSEAQRTPRMVVEAVEASGEVRLERRGEPDFLIMRADRAEQARDGLNATARLLRQLVHLNNSVFLAKALIDALPWTGFLPEADRQAFVEEFVWTLQACADLDFWTPLGKMLHEWEATAKVHAEPGLAAALARPVTEDLGPVLMEPPEVVGEPEAE